MMAKKERDISREVIDCPIAKKKWHGEYTVKATLITLGNGSVLVLCPMQAACLAHDNKKCPYNTSN